MTAASCRPDIGFELRFSPLFEGRRGFAFPCDASGRVDIDALTERQKLNYLFARGLIGSDFGMPAVLPRTLH